MKTTNIPIKVNVTRHRAAGKLQGWYIYIPSDYQVVPDGMPQYHLLQGKTRHIITLRNATGLAATLVRTLAAEEDIRPWSTGNVRVWTGDGGGVRIYVGQQHGSLRSGRQDALLRRIHLRGVKQPIEVLSIGGNK